MFSMMKKTKTGRPRKNEQAKQSLAHRATLERTCGRLGKLVDRIIDQDIDEGAIAKEIEDITLESADFEFTSTDREKSISTPETERLQLMAKLSELRKKQDGLEGVAERIALMLEETKHESADVQRQLKRSIDTRPPVASYQHLLLTKLAAAGITKQNASQILVSDLKALLGKSNRSKHVPAAKTSEAERHSAVTAEANDIHHSRQPPWLAFLQDGQTRYLITERPLSFLHSKTTINSLMSMDYPPHMDLEEYGQTELFEKFKLAKTPQEMRILIEKTCRAWIVEQRSERNASEFWLPRKELWTFLLALKYDFAHEMPNTMVVRLPSSNPNETFIEAVRR